MLVMLAGCATSGKQAGASTAEANPAPVAALPARVAEAFAALEADRARAERHLAALPATDRAAAAEAWAATRQALNGWQASVRAALETDVNPVNTAAFNRRLDETQQKYAAFLAAVRAVTGKTGPAYELGLVAPLFALGSDLYRWVERDREARLPVALSALEAAAWPAVGG